ncbi:MAG: hypothetical protein OXH41_09720 [Chloroflexi bacterium]|nr:hypothetical protein [Chloroflexota bacterium]
MASEAVPEPPPPESSREALQLIMFRLSSQQEAWTRMKSRAVSLVGLSLAIAGVYAGILTASDTPPGVWEWWGVGVIFGGFCVAAILFGWVHWPAKVETAPDPHDINERVWEGEVAIWSWAHSLEDAFAKNSERVWKSSRLNSASMAVVGIQGMAFMAFTLRSASAL